MLQANHGPYFSIKRDIGIVNADGNPMSKSEQEHYSDTTFFCKACLEDVPLEERSQKDIRYCTFCQPIIENEYQMVADRKERPLSHFYKGELPAGVVPPTKPQGQNVLPTETVEFYRCHNSTDSPRRGPKPKSLPEERIKEMYANGLGVKAIAHELEGDGVAVSAQTISRLLRGERR